MKIQKLIVVTAFALSLQACSTWRGLDDSERGAVIGGGSGALIGNAVSPGVGGTVIGGAAGAVGGALIGNEMDERDRHR